MSTEPMKDLLALEGRQVSLALVDGSRIDDCQLVSAGRRDLRTVWVFACGIDTFVPLAKVRDVWETAPARCTAA